MKLFDLRWPKPIDRYDDDWVLVWSFIISFMMFFALMCLCYYDYYHGNGKIFNHKHTETQTSKESENAQESN